MALKTQESACVANLRYTTRSRLGVRLQQSTIAQRIACEGVGLHSGEAVTLALSPAHVDTGIVFVALGAAPNGGDVEIAAAASSVVSSTRATTLGSPCLPGALAPRSAADARWARIATVEHLLATLLALGLDNVRVEVSGPEIPVMDGCARFFVDWVRQAGKRTQDADRVEVAITERIEIRDSDRWIRIEPAPQLQISYAIEFANPCIGRQALAIPALTESVFEAELAAARTFGFTHELEALREAGLGLGGNMENTIVVGEEKILNDSGLRWPDEFVRHKIVDLLGDLALLGVSIRGHIEVERGGHRLHHGLVKALDERLQSGRLVASDRTQDELTKRSPRVLALAKPSSTGP